MKKESFHIFISYATADSARYEIPKIAEKLSQYPEIQQVLYWEEHMDDDIYKYMNENLKKCDVLLLFCSPTALKSEPVEMEWMAALKLKKKIIPLFEREEDIPPLLTTKLGVALRKDLDATVGSLHSLILKKKKKGTEETREIFTEEKNKKEEEDPSLLEGNFSLEALAMKVSQALFGGENSVKMGDREFPVEKYGRTKLRHVKVDSFQFLEQNPQKPSYYGKLAKEGKKILWILKGSTYYARLIDNEFAYL